jgi:fructoselysine-6-P-deglycase FrlB-like protein
MRRASGRGKVNTLLFSVVQFDQNLDITPQEVQVCAAIAFSREHEEQCMEWYLDAEIDSQPGSWRRAAGLAGRLRELLPPGRIALTGCGTSYYMAQTIAALWESHGFGQADAFAASEMPVRRDYSRVVVISRSGTTTELLDLLERLGDVPTLALAGSEGPVTRRTTDAILLDFADEQSVVQTRFATSVVAAFRALVGDDVEALAARAQAALTESAPGPAAAQATPTGAGGPERRRFVFLGTGAGVGLAHEAALKLREAAQVVTESYPAMEYRHGPVALAEPGVVVWLLGLAPAGLADDVRATGAMVVDDDLDPLVDLVRVHRLAAGLAQAKGLDPDHPRHLTRAVLLT